MTMERSIRYFERCGAANTGETLRLARERADALELRTIVVASYTGETGAGAAAVFGGFDLVVCGGVCGFREPNAVAMRDAHRAAIEAAGGRIFFAGHAFGMIGRAVDRRLGGAQADGIVANTLRLFGQGAKVCCEIACMAADAGLVCAGSEVVAIAGTGKGADTAIVLTAANTHTFFDTRIREIVCMPRA
ncbi:MAG: hypothetical protein JW876_09965 [Candidatus Krumholzibacteriota bacterium]|nr:hypothetical protein [Candidatus Krumholzibacteriota bacterium]